MAASPATVSIKTMMVIFALAAMAGRRVRAGERRFGRIDQRRRGIDWRPRWIERWRRQLAGSTARHQQPGYGSVIRPGLRRYDWQRHRRRRRCRRQCRESDARQEAQEHLPRLLILARK
ncbi:hypothetical protein ABH980_004114 [Bradyrhizobium ottawaense]